MVSGLSVPPPPPEPLTPPTLTEIKDFQESAKAATDQIMQQQPLTETQALDLINTSPFLSPSQKQAYPIF